LRELAYWKEGGKRFSKCLKNSLRFHFLNFHGQQRAKAGIAISFNLWQVHRKFNHEMFVPCLKDEKIA